MVALAMLTAAVMASLGLSNHLFWDDEANTAIYARNLIELGRITAFDGTNVLGYAYGGALGEDLGRELRVPSLPAYVAAAGMMLCGQTTFGGRIMFVAAGVLSVGLLAVWLRRHFGPRFPWWLPPLILAFSPAYLLFIRNCRYYSLGVAFTLLVWIFWAPGRRRDAAGRGPLSDPRFLLRCCGCAVALVLLLSTHYLNAATVLVTLPLFLLERDYRSTRQYVLLGVVYATALVYALWVLATVNPFGTEYDMAEDWLFGTGPKPDALFRFVRHLWWLLRDLGTHEFLPWCLLVLLPVPWLPAARLPRAVLRLRRWSLQGMILLAVVLVYVLVAALLTPADMAKGPTAEMRYAVPLLTLGAALGGLALVILWELARPLAPPAFVLLIASNLPHLGFVIDRSDGTRSWWPPTLTRYVGELFDDYTTGNEALIALLEELPPGTTVRTWPTYATHPAMFYVPKLRYCDQLTEAKPLREDLRSALADRDYLFVERARPDVVLVPAPYLAQTQKVLDARFGPGTYRMRKTLAPHWNYTSKPEIPRHFFKRPSSDWLRFPGIVVLAAVDRPVIDHPALASNAADFQAMLHLGLALKNAGEAEAAIAHFQRAIRIDPDRIEPHVHLGVLLLTRRKPDAAAEQFETAVRIDPKSADARLKLGTALEELNRPEEAHRQYTAALAMDPEWPLAHYNLANLLVSQGKLDAAIEHYRTVLRLDPEYIRARVNLGNALLDQGKTDEAMQHFRSAIQIQPDFVPARLNMARAMLARGSRPAAIAEFRRALALIPPNTPLAEQVRGIIRELEE